jgi:hypothetical protein
VCGRSSFSVCVFMFVCEGLRMRAAGRCVCMHVMRMLYVVCEHCMLYAKVACFLCVDLLTIVFRNVDSFSFRQKADTTCRSYF